MTVPAHELRAWAEGDYPTEASVELLIRAHGGRFARESQPWIERLGPPSTLYRVNWNRLHQDAGVFSGGERRFLNIAISMGSPDHPVDLSNNLSGLDDDLLLLVLAATAHAAGRPRLLSPATALATPPATRRTSSPTHGSNDSTDPPRHRPVRRPEDERWAADALQERREGPRP
jgi:hypothetical protein